MLVEGVYAEPGRAVRLWLFVTRSGLSCFLANYGKKKKKVSESRIVALRGRAQYYRNTGRNRPLAAGLNCSQDL